MPSREYIDFDDVFNDLLKTASFLKTADDPINTDSDKALYRGDPVTVVERGSSLSKIIREEEEPFWVKTKDLKPIPVPKQPRSTGPQPPPTPTQPMIDMETYVESVGCIIWIEVLSVQRDRAVAQYEADVKRPLTPAEDKYIIIVEGRPPSYGPEWRVTFKAPDSALGVQLTYHHEEKPRSDIWRVNKREFARYLVIHGGFVLGKNDPKPAAAIATPESESPKAEAQTAATETK